MTQPDALREHAAGVIDPVELGPDELEASDIDLATILGVLAHEFRNPLASMQGCAQTLLERGDALDAGMRHRLTEVIVKNAQRLDWLVRAAATFGGAGGRAGDVDTCSLADLARQSCASSGAALEVGADADVVVNERRATLALEAVLLGLGEGARMLVNAPTVEVCAPRTDIGRGSRRWKFHLASSVLREQGATMHVVVTSHGTAVTIRFGRPRVHG